MLLHRIYDEDLAQASYFIGCQARGEAVVIDPRRDLDEYFEVAEANGMKIVAVTETHIHADYLSGTRELAAATGATVYLSGEGGKDWQYEFEGERLHHGDSFDLGNITVEAVHTPGHTPEHLSFLITDGAFSDEPGYLISGDFIFAGDLGRPDLLDEAAGGVDTRFVGAQQLFTSLQDTFLTLPDHVQVYPGHGAGSACGKALGALPATTVGYERRYAWWAKYLAADDAQGFIDELLDSQPDAHAYFGRMKRQNRQGPVVLGHPLQPLPELSTEQVAGQIADGEVIVVDSRSHDQVHQGTVAGSINIPGADKAATYGAWAYDPETDTAPLVLLSADQEEAEKFRAHLIRVGIDRVSGYLTSLDGLPTITPELLSPVELEGHEHDLLLDVRNKTEYSEGHIPGAHQLSAGRVLWNLGQLPDGEDATIVSYCRSGVRNSVAASALRRKGYRVIELEGSYLGWEARHATV